LECSNPKSLPLDVRAWFGHALTASEKAELAAMPDPGPYVPPTPDEMAGWSPELREWFAGRSSDARPLPIG